ncbi:MAG: AEC family transporter [Mesorhizobium sp.]
MSTLVETILFVFGLVAAGYLSGLIGYLRVETGDAVAEFAVAVALPLLLFRTMLTADFEGAAPWALWGCYFTAVAVTWTTAHLAMTRGFGRDARAGVVGGVTGAFSNLVLLGIPFMLGIFGQEGFEILSMLVAVHLPTMIAASIILFEWVGRGEGEPKSLAQLGQAFLRRMFTNPLIIGILLGLAMRFVGVTLPALPLRLIDSLANVAGPIALFAMGLSLRKYGIARNVPAGVVLSGLKLVLMPAVALAMAWLLGLPPLTAKVVVAAASLPAGVNSYLIAMQFGTGQALASNAMTIGTAAAVFTTAMWLAIAQMVFG